MKYPKITKYNNLSRKKEILFKSCATNYRNEEEKEEENLELASNLSFPEERFFRGERRIKLRVVATKNRRVDSQGFRVYEQRFPFPRPRNRIYAGKTRDRKGFARYPFNFRATFQFLPSTPTLLPSTTTPLYGLFNPVPSCSGINPRLGHFSDRATFCDHVVKRVAIRIKGEEFANLDLISDNFYREYRIRS